jgi:hypothetical protein
MMKRSRVAAYADTVGNDAAAVSFSKKKKKKKKKKGKFFHR